MARFVYTSDYDLMTLLLNCSSISKAFGSRQLFSHLSFGVFQGDKIGLIGPNGSGKSSLLKILAGLDNPDEGTVACKKSLRIGYVPQTSEYPSLSVEDTVFGVASEAFPNAATYDLHTQVRIILSQLGFKDHQQYADQLSGGWKKRLDIAKELIRSPDLLLLDEPTNHLDLEGILWLEGFLRQTQLAFIVTSHDRYFLQNSANKMMELNSIYPQGLFCCEGNYSEFLERREEFVNQQHQMQRSLASKVRAEVHWLRQSPKARTTKAQARVQGAERLIQEFQDVKMRNKVATAKIDFEASERQTRKLLTVKNLSKSIAGRQLFSALDLTITPGMRLGIAGANGSGKTTLLRLLAGEIAPDKGTIKYADDLKIVYFDQHRQKLSPQATLKEALSPNSDIVTYRGQSIHVNSWAKRFLFSPERIDLPVAQLSGGERARIAIARLMLQPADLLLLDEPTNDLDIATLETLEESLKEFAGAIVLITHDRALLDQVATHVVGLGVTDTPPLLADYLQWEEYVKDHTTQEKSVIRKVENVKNEKSESLPEKKKLSYREKRELEQMESAIVAVEEEIERLHLLTEQCQPHQHEDLKSIYEQLEQAHARMEQLFARWQELESIEK